MFQTIGPEILTCTSTKIYMWQINIWRDVLHHGSSGKCKWKLQWDITHYNGYHAEHWQHRMLVRIWSNRNSYPLWVEMWNGTDTLEDSVVVS
jgi:hypothetical protein